MGTSPAGQRLMGADSGTIYKKHRQPLREQEADPAVSALKGKKDKNVKNGFMQYPVQLFTKYFS